MACNEPSLALVTGGSRGIGKAIVCALVQKGWEVITCSRNQTTLTQTYQSLNLLDQVHCFSCDLKDPHSIHQLFQEVDRIGKNLRVVVNNAGIGKFGSIEETSLEMWEEVMNVNARGTFLCMQHAFRRMKRHGQGGWIINIASVVGIKGYSNQSVYTASKHAIMGLTRVGAREGQPYGIRCHAICPGGVDTDLVREARPDLNPEELIRPEDVAQAVCFLIEQSRFAVTDMIQIRRANSLPDF